MFSVWGPSHTACNCRTGAKNGVVRALVGEGRAVDKLSDAHLCQQRCVREPGGGLGPFALAIPGSGVKTTRRAKASSEFTGASGHGGSVCLLPNLHRAQGNPRI